MRYFIDIYNNLVDSETDEVVVTVGTSFEQAFADVLNHVEKHYVKKVVVEDD